MTAGEALREGARTLAGSAGGSDTPLLDASLILAGILGISKEALYAAGPEPLAESHFRRFRADLARRASGLPIAYILGRKEFYGREFRVDERVLIPRPDTELLVEAALAEGDRIATRVASEASAFAVAASESRAWARATSETGASTRGILVHEACVGSGAVAVSLACERPGWSVSASDLSPSALEIAAINAQSLVAGLRRGGKVVFATSDLLSSVEGPFHVIVANPPYVPSLEVDALLAQGWGEPRMALDGGPDGLELCRLLAHQAAARLLPGGALLVEADPGQAVALREIFIRSGFDSVETFDDLAGLERVTIGRMPWKS